MQILLYKALSLFECADIHGALIFGAKKSNVAHARDRGKEKSRPKPKNEINDDVWKILKLQMRE